MPGSAAIITGGAMSADLAAIERAAIKAWPALETAPIEGWLWRFSSGGSQRANSVATVGTVTDPEAAIAEAERRYRARGAPPQFLVTDAAFPSDLDRRLAARGYRVNDLCTVLVREVRRGAASPAGVEMTDAPTPDWLEVYLSCISESRRPVAPRIVAGIPGPRVFCTARHRGEAISTALGCALDGVVVAECVATRADRRRLGGAEAVMSGVEAWAATIGARTLALGAVAANAPAQALYARIGYRRAGHYRMRIKD